MDSYGLNNPALAAMLGAGDGSGAMEDTNTGRFEDSIAGDAEDCGDNSGIDECYPNGHGDQDNRHDAGGGGGRSAALPPANSGRVVASSRWGGPEGSPDDDPPPAEPPREGRGDPRHPDDGGGGAGAQDGEVIG